MTTAAQSLGEDRSRAGRPGSRRLRTAAAVTTFAVLLGLLGNGIYGLVVGHTARFVPTNGRAADHLLIGTYARPALTIAGDEVRARTPAFSALAVVTGPLVPGEGFSYQPSYVTATWIIHIWGASHKIPLSAADFDSIDHTGNEYRLVPPPGTRMPGSVPAGGQVTFELRAVVPIGEDLFRWAPNGNDIVAKWDSQVEND